MIRMAIALPQDECRIAAFEGAVLIGRDARCDLPLQGRGVSSSHCRISAMPGLAGAFMVEDLGSTYGTYVNGQRVGKPVVVSERDVVTVGSYRLVLVGAAGDAAAIERARAGDAPPVKAASTPSQPPQPSGVLADFDASAPWPQQFARMDALAHAWHDAGRPKAKLLHGNAIRIGERWLEAGVHRDPSPDALHREFIVASRRRASGRTRGLVLGVVGVAVLGLAIVGWITIAPHLDDLFADTPALVDDTTDPSDSGGLDTPEPPPEIDIAALLERSLSIDDPRARLLVQAGIAEAARAQGKLSLAEDGWAVHAATQRTFAALRETVLVGHEQGITGVAFGASRRIVSSSADGSARLWDLSTPAPTLPTTLRGHLGSVNAVGVTPDGRFAVTIGEDGTVRRWDLSTPDPGATGRVMRKHRGPVTHVAMHPAGRFAVTGDDNGTLVAWDLEAEDPEATASDQVAHEALVTDLVFDRGEPPSLYSGSDDRLVRRWRVDADGLHGVQKLAAHTGGVTAIAVGHDARFVASGGTDGEVWLWDRKPKGKEKIALLGHTESVNDLAFTPDGQLLVSGGDDDTLRVWEVTAADPGLAHVKLEGHTGDITSVAIAAGGKRAVSAGLDNTVRVWDLTKKDLRVDQSVLEGHVAEVTGIDVASDGQWIVSGSADATVRVWDGLSKSTGRGGKVLRLGAGQVLDLDVTKLGDQLVAVGEDGRAAIWDLRDDARLLEPRWLPDLRGLVTATAFDPRGRFVATGSETGEIRLFSLTTAEAARTLAGHSESVNALAFTPDGERLLSVSSDRTVRSWPVAGGEASVWSAHIDDVHELAITPKGDYAFTGALDGMVIRWTITDGTSMQLRGHEEEVVDIAISPDGKFVATASADRRARLWDVATGSSTYVLRGHDEPVTAVAFSGRDKLATGGKDRKILLWDLASKHPDEAPRVLGHHEQSVSALAFVADGSILVSGSNDATVRLWRLQDGDSIILGGHDNVVDALRITSDGRYAISSSYDGTLRLWPLDHERLIQLACDVLGIPASPQDWTAFFGTPAPPAICTKSP
jgi:WD40 repeat protein